MNEPKPATNNSPAETAPPASPVQASGSAREAGRGEIRTPPPDDAGSNPPPQAKPEVAKPDVDPETPPAQKA